MKIINKFTEFKNKLDNVPMLSWAKRVGAIIGAIGTVIAIIQYVLAPTFSIDVQPSAFAINESDAKALEINLNNQYMKSYKYPVNLTAIVDPPETHIKFNFSRVSCSVPSEATMMIYADKNTPKGNYRVTIIAQGKDNSISESHYINMNVVNEGRRIIKINSVNSIILNAKHNELYNITDKYDTLKTIREQIDMDNPMLISIRSKPYLIAGYDFTENNKIMIGLMHSGSNQGPNVTWMNYNELFNKINSRELYIIYETTDYEAASDNNSSDNSKSGEPVDVISSIHLCLVLDRSGSMDIKIERVREAAIDVVNNLLSQDSISVVSFSDDCTTNTAFTSDFNLAINGIKDIRPGGDTSFGMGLDAALRQFEAQNSSGSLKAILFMSDGYNNTNNIGGRSFEECVARCRDEGIRIFTIGFGATESDVDRDLLTNMSDSAYGIYRFENDILSLGNTFIELQSIASSWKSLSSSEGYLSQGQTANTSAYNSADHSYLKVLLNWPGSDLDLSLIDPNGTKISYSKPNIYYSGNDTKPEYIIVKDPTEGKWTANIYGKSLTQKEKYWVLFSQYEPFEFDETLKNKSYDYNSFTGFKIFGGHGFEEGRSISMTRDNGYVIAGMTDSYGFGGKDVWLLKVDSNGVEEWNRTYGGGSNDWGISVKEAEDGGYIVAGWTDSYGHGDRDAWLIKTDSKGEIEWTNAFGGSKHDEANSVLQTDDGGYLILGLTDSYSSGMQDIWLVRTDSKGKEKWNKSLGGKWNDASLSMVKTQDGCYVLGASKEFKYNDFDIWMVKIDASGQLVWDKTVNYPGNNFAESVINTIDGGYIVLISMENAFGADNICDKSDYILLAKFNSDGNLKWTKPFCNAIECKGHSVHETNDGDLVFTGYAIQNKERGREVFLVKTDSEGKLIWDRKFGWDRGSWDCGWSVLSTPDGGCAIAGSTKSDNAFADSDLLLIKTGFNGTI